MGELCSVWDELRSVSGELLDGVVWCWFIACCAAEWLWPFLVSWVHQFCCSCSLWSDWAMFMCCFCSRRVCCLGVYCWFFCYGVDVLRGCPSCGCYCFRFGLLGASFYAFAVRGVGTAGLLLSSLLLIMVWNSEVHNRLAWPGPAWACQALAVDQVRPGLDFGP